MEQDKADNNTINTIFDPYKRAISLIQASQSSQSSPVEVGHNIVNELYQGDYAMADKKKCSSSSPVNILIQLMKADTFGRSPSGETIHNSVKLAIDDHRFNQDDEISSIYKELDISQKLILIKVSDYEIKKKFIKMIHRCRCTNNKLQSIINDEKLENTPISLNKHLYEPMLRPYTQNQIVELKANLEKKIQLFYDKLGIINRFMARRYSL